MSETASEKKRRIFIKECCAIGIGGVVGAAPLIAGLTVLLDPLTKKGGQGIKVKIASLESLPEDGIPIKLSIIATRADAWNKYPEAPIGAVYIRRTGPQKVEALNAVCPHAGCFVDYRSALGGYFCPCHNSTFSLDGKIANPKSPSPRPMDSLEVEVINGNEVWVNFQNFYAGREKKVVQT